MTNVRPSCSRQVKIGEGSFLITSDDDYLTRHVGESFEPHTCELFQSLVRKEHSVLDVGANVGCTSLLFGQIADTVISVEPSPSTFRFLDLNIRNSGLKNVTPHNVGLGVRDERLPLTFAPSNRSGGFVSNRTQASQGHVVEQIDIRNGDAFLAGRNVDFVKIDVEGFEKHVIQGLEGTIARSKPVVSLELNHWCLNAFQRTSIPDFFDFLRGVFPMLFAVEGGKYANLHDPNHSYVVMYDHIMHFRWPNLVGAFDEGQVAAFRARYSL